MRFILKCNIRTHVNSMLEILGIMKLKQKLFFNIHKMKINMLLNYVSQNITYNYERHNYKLPNVYSMTLSFVRARSVFYT